MIDPEKWNRFSHTIMLNEEGLAGGRGNAFSKVFRWARGIHSFMVRMRANRISPRAFAPGSA